MHRSLLLAPGLLLACIQPPALRHAPDDFGIVDVVAPGGDLRAVGRLVSLRLRFERPLATPPDDAVMLLTGAPSDALRADANDGLLSASNAARRLPLRVAVDARDARTIVIEAQAPQLPDAALTLLVTPQLRARDGGAFVDEDGDARAWAQPLTVAPARRCGAIGRVEAPERVTTALGRVYVRFDRAVRGEGLALRDDHDRSLDARTAIDCGDDASWGRCAWIEPTAPLPANTRLHVVARDDVSRNGLAPEAVLGVFTTSTREVQRVALAPSPVCASDERVVAQGCLRVDDGALVLRVATTREANVRVTAVPGADLPRKRIGVGAWGTLHAVRVRSLVAGVTYSLEVEALGADGHVHASARVDGVTTPAAHPRVRIAEVLARPRGASTQEFVELINDDDIAIELDDFSLAQEPLRAALPPGLRIAPGQRALVVGSAYDPRGDTRSGDEPVAPGTPVAVMRGAVAGRGLRDTGADLTLRAPDGVVVSRVPGADPGRAPRAGVSLVRADLDLDDDDPAAWTWDARDGSTPGAPDRLR